MRKIISNVALACALLAGGAAYAQPVHDASEAWLLGQIRAGEALYRDDLVQGALARLYGVAPSNPAGLVAELRLALRQNDADRARQILDRLRNEAAGSEALKQAEVLMALRQPDQREQLQTARLYAVAGRTAEALAIYDRLLGGVYPSLELAVEYWRLRAGVDGDRGLALRQLEQLDQQYPRNIPLRQTLVNLYFSEDRDDRALAMLEALAKDPHAREQAADRAYAFLAEQPSNQLTLDRWRAYLTTYVGASRYNDAAAKTKQLEALMADPAWVAGIQGREQLEHGQDRQALAALQRAARAYPQNAEILGSLGLAYQRAGQRQLAAQYYEAAIKYEQDGHHVTRWVDLANANRYWLALQQAEQELKAGRYARARALYNQARAMEPGEVYAVMGLGDVALAAGDAAAAERHYLQARRIDRGSLAPVRALVALYRTQSDDKVLAFLDSLPAAMQRQYADVRLAIRLDRLQAEAERATEAGDWARASQVMAEIRQHRPDDTWLAYRLAGALQQQGRGAEADTVFADLLQRNGREPTARYAHALFLSSRNETGAALRSLANVDEAAWTPEMRELDQRLHQEQVLAQARQLREAGREPAAVALVKGLPPTQATDLTLAGWAQARGDHAEAQHYYAAILAREPGQPDARLGQIETWLEAGDAAQAQIALVSDPPKFPPEDFNGQRRLGNAWAQAGDTRTGTQLLSRLVQRQTEPDALLHRDYGRLIARDEPELALDQYALAMQDAGMLEQTQAAPRDNAAFTRATVPQTDDDWLRSSVRSGAEELYQQRNPTVTLQHDFALRTDGTPGFSRVRNQTTMLHGERPLGQGRVFVRAEQIFLDAGTFETDASGAHQERFGHCAAVTGGCSSYLRQRTHGTGLAVGWAGERLAFDLGVTPLGFERTNIVGGITYSGDLGPMGWSLTASRRPMTNSLLSYAGAIDPVTGDSWGGVTANGVTLSMSWDQGGANGVWANIGHHYLRGHNVENNTRTRLMGGYYRRLINRPDERLSIGVNSMLWRYAKDLGDYSFGQGGYYSPKHYFSLSLPVSYAHRTQDWSFLLEGSVSWSRSRSSGGPVYPLGDPSERLAASMLNPFAALENTPSSSRGFGYSLRAAAERRVSDNLVVGLGLDVQKSEDYTPSRAFLYLRYSFNPWRGNMPLPLQTLTPHGEWR